MQGPPFPPRPTASILIPISNLNQPMATKTGPAMSQLINSNMIVGVISKHFGVQLKPVKKPIYRKPYPDWIDRVMPLPKGYKVPYFFTFLGDDDKSTMEHVSRFTAQCGEEIQNDYYKLQLFLLSLIRIAFTWYYSLLHNSVQNWADMERSFHDRFYRPLPKVIVADLMNLKQ